MIDNDDDAQNELHNQEQNILDQKQENFIDYAGVQDQQQKLLPDASDSEYFSLYFGAKARNYSDFQPNQQLALNAYYQMFTEWCKNPESFHQKEDYYSFNSLLLYLKNAKAAMNINFLDSLMTQNNVTSERLYDQFYQIINQNLIEAELFST